MAKQIQTVDDGLAFAISQLAALSPKVFETKYADITFMQDVDVQMDIPDHVDNWDYISYDQVGIGKFLGSSADDLPRVAINATKSTVKLAYGGNLVEYSLDELRKSQAINMPIDTSQLQAARRAFEEHAQRVCYFGDADRGMLGLYNNANVALDNSTTDWSSATGADIVADADSLLQKVIDDSKGAFLPNELHLDGPRFGTISSKRMDSGTDTTVLAFLKKNNQYTLRTGQELVIKPRYQLVGAGAGGKDRMVAYGKSPDNIVMKMAFALRPLPPQAQGLNIQIPCEYKFAGTEIIQPLAAAYRDHV